MKVVDIIILICMCSVLNGQQIDLSYGSCTGCPQGVNSNPAMSTALYQYEAETFDEQDVESDFDIRNAGGNTRWHKGLDLKDHGRGTGDQMRGDAIICPEGGTIVRLQHQDFKYIVIDGNNHDFGYGHIFSHNEIDNTSAWRSGNFVLKMDLGVNGMNQEPAIINLNTCTAYSTITGRRVVLVNNPHCNDTLVTTNIVADGASIAPIGGSRNSATRDYDVHLHLYKFRNPSTGNTPANCMDPMVDLDFEGTSLDLQMALNQNIHDFSQVSQENTEFNYPGDSYNSIACRIEMEGAMMGFDSSRYNNAVHSVDLFQLKIKSFHQDSFVLIEGPNYESKLCLGARSQTEIYPLVLSDSNHEYGSMTTTGIHPSAYRDDPYRFRPWDDYYFSDFVTRIHRNDPMDGDTTVTMIANCPSQSRYPDGQYDLLATVTDVRDSTFNSDTITFELDNWKPYVKSVVCVANSINFYNESWTCSDSCIQFSNSGTLTQMAQSDFDDGMRIEVTLSEPIPDLRLSIPAYGITDEEIYGIMADDSTEVFFYFDRSQIELGTTVILHFSGSDVSGNNLISFSANQISNCTQVPHRTSDSTWMPAIGYDYGVDSLHSFYFECGDGRRLAKSYVSNPTIITLNPSSLDITANVTHATNTSGSNGAINITVDNGIAPYSYKWYSPNSPFTSDAEDLVNLSPGIYCVEVKDTLCSTGSECFEVFGCSDFNINATIVKPCHQFPDGVISLSNNAMHGPLSYSWTNGASTSTISNISAGNYCVTITDTINCSEIVCHVVNEKHVLLGIEHHGHIVCEGKKGMLTAAVTSDAVGPVNYIWSNGATTPTIDNLDPGYYSVTVTDNTGCSDSHYINLKVISEAVVLNDSDFNVIDGCNSNGAVVVNRMFEPTATYSWTGPNGFTSTSKHLDYVDAGEYCLKVFDASGCIVARGCAEVNCIDCSDRFTLLFVDIERPSYGTNSVQCENSPHHTFDDGSISVGVRPAGNYQYRWSNGQSDSVATNLGRGNYCVTVSDGVCSQTLCYSLWPCQIIIPSGFGGICIVDPQANYSGNLDVQLVERVHVSDSSPCSGSLELSVSSSSIVNSYIYNWSDNWGSGGQNNFPRRDSLCEGTYCVTVDDGCNEVVECYEIVNCDNYDISVSESITNTCPGAATGSVSISPTSGEAPYVYNWSNGSNESKINDLTAGQYCVSINDGIMCPDPSVHCFTVLDNVEPDTTRQGCNLDISCNGEYLESIRLEFEWLPDPQDCGTELKVCSDGLIVDSKEVGYSEVTDFSADNCEVVRYCLQSGLPPHDTIFGVFKNEFLDEMEGCIWCHQISYCDFKNTEYGGIHDVYLTSNFLLVGVNNSKKCSESEEHIRIYCDKDNDGFFAGDQVVLDTCISTFPTPAIQDLIDVCDENDLDFRYQAIPDTIFDDGEYLPIIRYSLVDFDTSALELLLTRGRFTESARSRDEDFSIYPNPANDIIYVDSKHSSTGYAISIVSIDGHRIKRLEHSFEYEPKCSISVGDLKAGYYILRLENNEKTYHYDFIKL